MIPARHPVGSSRRPVSGLPASRPSGLPAFLRPRRSHSRSTSSLPACQSRRKRRKALFPGSGEGCSRRRTQYQGSTSGQPTHRPRRLSLARAHIQRGMDYPVFVSPPLFPDIGEAKETNCLIKRASDRATDAPFISLPVSGEGHQGERLLRHRRHHDRPLAFSEVRRVTKVN